MDRGGNEKERGLNYYESVVIDYLRADRALFVNTECCIQLNAGSNPDSQKGAHWYCDAVVADFRDGRVFLCEISYSNALYDLIQRLEAWNAKWDGVAAGLHRDSWLPAEWEIRPWLFVPNCLIEKLVSKLDEMKRQGQLRFVPRITPLEMVQPWLYPSWNRIGEGTKPERIPRVMQD